MKKFPGFFPKNDPELVRWLTLYEVEIVEQWPATGLTAEQTEVQRRAARELIEAILLPGKIKLDYKAAVTAKKLSKKKNMRLISNSAYFMKATRSVTSALLRRLGLEGGSIIIDEDTIKATIKLTEISAGIRIDFIKYDAPAISIYSRVKGGEWKLLATEIDSPYFDMSPAQVPGVPEIREYKAICRSNIREIGIQSGVHTAVFREL